MARFPDRQLLLLRVQSKGILIREAEEGRLGVNHAEIGGWLFQQWKLNKGLVAAVACHHNPALADEHVKAAAIVHLGDIFARALMHGTGGDDQIPTVSQVAWAALGLKIGDLPALLRESDREFARAAVFLEFAQEE